MRHSVSRWDQVRLARLQAQLGQAPDRNVLWLADGIRLGGAYPGRLISDAMVAAWAADAALRARFADLGQAPTQRAFLAWYCCEAAAAADVAATLRAAAALRLAESDDPALPLTALIDIAAAHCLAAGGAPPSRGQAELIAWFYRGGAVAAGVSHHITAQERAALRARGLVFHDSGSGAAGAGRIEPRSGPTGRRPWPCLL